MHNEQRMRRWYAFLIWLVGTLIAIAVIGENLYLGVGLAVVFGILLGLMNLFWFNAKS